MITLNQNGFLRYPGTYRELDCYKKSVVLYDLTYWYITRYLQASDRTFGQMQQAARSGKQNIVEGLERYDGMLAYCRKHDQSEDYARYYDQWDIETMCNTALTLIHQVDRGLMKLLAAMEENFLTNGGVREQMTAARKQQRGFYRNRRTSKTRITRNNIPI